MNKWPCTSDVAVRQKAERLQVMQRLDSAISFVDRVAVENGRAALEAELLTA